LILGGIIFYKALTAKLFHAALHHCIIAWQHLVDRILVYRTFKTVIMKKIVFVFSILFFTLAASAQEYNNAVGIRLGPNSANISPGFTIKHFLNATNAVEGIVGVSNGIGLCALYEWHHPIESAEHLNWFVGAGGYAAFRYSTSFIGAAGIVGLDYKFEQIPLNISVDWKPELNLITNVGFEASGVGVSARFTF
jgi:uncharacterized membrane protein